MFSAYLDREVAAEVTRLGTVPLHKGEAEASELVPHAVLAMRRATRLHGATDSAPRSGSVAKCSATAAFARRFGFTPRERETLDLLVACFSQKEIAYHFGRKPGTVRRHIQGACSKCGAGNQQELLVKFMRSVSEGERLTDVEPAPIRAKVRTR